MTRLRFELWLVAAIAASNSALAKDTLEHKSTHVHVAIPPGWQSFDRSLPN